MLRVLIIDDEPAVRAGLKAIIDWNSLGYEVAGEAADGHEGLSKLLELTPDLCITDIRMPGLYGTKMLEQARKGGFGGKVIVLTGYSDFEYARSAIETGVSSFQLKPIDEDDLCEALVKVREVILSEKKNLEELNSGMRVICEKQLTDLICGRLRADSINLEGLNLLDSDYRIAVITSQQCATDVKALFLNEKDMRCICIDDLWIVLVQGKEIKRFLTIMTIACRKYSGLFVTVGRKCHMPDELSLSYADAKNIQKQSFFYRQSGNIVVWEDVQGDFTGEVRLDTINISDYIEAFYTYIEIGQEELLHRKMKAFESECRSLGMRPGQFAGVISNIFIRVCDMLSQNYQNIEFPEDGQVIRSIYEKQGLHEIIEYILEGFVCFMQQIGNNSHENIAKRLCMYIEANYAKDLKLEALSKIFCYNSSYLGRIFRTYTGESFNSYLDHVRIRKAKEMLGEGKYKVYEISQRVGYKNIDYFYRKFKYYVGQKPKEYLQEDE
jgi:two-component system response regulator YesN